MTKLLCSIYHGRDDIMASDICIKLAVIRECNKDPDVANIWGVGAPSAFRSQGGHTRILSHL